MMHVTIDSPTQQQGCNSCCCESVSLKPGETQPLHLNYAHWAVPIGTLHCEPVVAVEEKQTCLVATVDFPPEITAEVKFSVPTNGSINGDLRQVVSDPEGAELRFKTLPLYLPKHGRLELQEVGPFKYTPAQYFVGEERFHLSATDGTSDPLIFEVMIAVGINAASMTATPMLKVGKPIVNQRFYTATLPISASPAVKTCQVFRLTIQQSALDCDCNCYVHNDCVDVKIAQC